MPLFEAIVILPHRHIFALTCKGWEAIPYMLQQRNHGYGRTLTNGAFGRTDTDHVCDCGCLLWAHPFQLARLRFSFVFLFGSVFMLK